MRVLIVTMPFAAIRPAMGPSLLAGQLRAIGASTRIAYLNMAFARQLGFTDYSYIADRAPPQSLAGDWVFSAALFGERPEADRDYRAAFEQRFAGSGQPLATLGRARRRAGAFVESCLEQVRWSDYDLIGFTSSFTQHAASLALAQRIKERHPESLIAFGGANCEDQMGLALHRAFPFVDFVCSGEADLSLPRLLSELAAGRDGTGIPGVIARGGGGAEASELTPERVRELDDLAYPEFDDFFSQWSANYPKAPRSRRILMESSRGCWWGQKHHCTFCGLNGLAMTYRRKSPDRVLDEITELAGRHDAEHVEMVDNILDLGYLDELLPELARRDLRLELFYETKANLRKDQLRVLRGAGVTGIQPGIESFSTSVLRLMRKGTSTAQNVQLLKWCAEIGIDAAWNLLYGFPGEDPADYEEMADLIERISHLRAPRGVGPIRLDRFSPNFVEAERLGLVDVRPDRSYRFIYDLPEELLNGLAYYFEHGYADGRDPSEYAAPTRAAIGRWLSGSGQGSGRLLVADHGDRLAIWDLRRGAERRLTVLTGRERQLYLFCDRHRSRAAIDAYLEECGEEGFPLDAFLDRLLEARLILAVDGRYLSLAVAVPSAPAAGGSEASEPRAELVF